MSRIMLEDSATLDRQSFPFDGVASMAAVTKGLTKLLAKVFIEY